MSSIINYSLIQFNNNTNHFVNFIVSKALFSSLHNNNSSHNTSLKNNRLITSISNLFTKTFPSESQIENQMNLNKQNAIKIKFTLKEISSEEILKYESSLPEWKRNAIVIVNSPPKTSSLKNKRYLFNLITYNPLSRTVISIYNKSDLKILMKDFKQSYSNLRYNLRFTSNPIIMLIRDVIDKVHFKSSVSQATEIMKKHRPNFNICVFEKEMKIVLKQLFTLYMNDDSKRLKMICCESAYAMLNNEIKGRREKSVELKFKTPIFIDEPVYQSAEIIDQDNVIMKLKVTLQECTSLIDTKTKSTVNKGVIESNQYIIDVIRNPVPFEEEFGHCYMIVNYQKIESTIQLF